MKLWIKRVTAIILIAVGAVLLFRHAKQLLDWPHLYPDMGHFSKENVIYLGLTLLAGAMAWISAAYLLLNCDKGILHFLIPAAVFALLVYGSSLTLTRAVGELPCSYTSSLSVCREEFTETDFHVDGRALYPLSPEGELTAYARYEKGEALAESLTRSYEQEEFIRESNRLQRLNVTAFRPPQDPREREVLCYQTERDGTLWQVLIVPKTKTVTYSRFRCPELLPDFAPQPSTEEQVTGEN